MNELSLDPNTFMQSLQQKPEPKTKNPLTASRKERVEHFEKLLHDFPWDHHGILLVPGRAPELISALADHLAGPSGQSRKDMDRYRKVAELRSQGRSYQSIAVELGVSPTRVRTMMHAYKRMTKEAVTK